MRKRPELFFKLSKLTGPLFLDETRSPTLRHKDALKGKARKVCYSIQFVMLWRTVFDKNLQFVHSTDNMLSRRLSVCLSVNHTMVLHRRGWMQHETINGFDRLGTLDFSHQKSWWNPDVVTPNVALNARAVGYPYSFRPTSRHLSETVSNGTLIRSHMWSMEM